MSSKRQRELARRRAERQAARRAELARKRRQRQRVTWGVFAAVLALLLGVFLVPKLFDGGDDTDPVAAPNASETAAPTPTPTPEALPTAVACAAKAPTAATPQKFDKAPEQSIDPKKKYTATIKTSCGEVVVDLLADKAPTTVNSFNFLAGKNYFDGTRCHRILTGTDSVLQCGDPTATGAGDPGYEFKDENLPKATGDTYVYPAGTVAMANSGPNTNGSQFFFVVKDSPFPPNYTVFGKVSKGQDVLDKLLAVGAAEGTDKPAEQIWIESFTVKASG